MSSDDESLCRERDANNCKTNDSTEVVVSSRVEYFSTRKILYSSEFMSLQRNRFSIDITCYLWMWMYSQLCSWAIRRIQPDSWTLHVMYKTVQIYSYIIQWTAGTIKWLIRFKYYQWSVIMDHYHKYSSAENFHIQVYISHQIYLSLSSCGDWHVDW